MSGIKLWIFLYKRSAPYFPFFLVLVARIFLVLLFVPSRRTAIFVNFLIILEIRVGVAVARLPWIFIILNA